MANFPTLTKNPSYPLGENRENSVLKTEFEGGYVQSRPKFTRLRRVWEVRYVYLPTADKETLDSFVNVTVRGGADAFWWTHPQADTSHHVRFAEPPKFEYITYQLWSCEFKLEEV